MHDPHNQPTQHWGRPPASRRKLGCLAAAGFTAGLVLVFGLMFGVRFGIIPIGPQPPAWDRPLFPIPDPHAQVRWTYQDGGALVTVENDGPTAFRPVVAANIDKTINTGWVYGSPPAPDGPDTMWVYVPANGEPTPELAPGQRRTYFLPGLTKERLRALEVSHSLSPGQHYPILAEKPSNSMPRTSEAPALLR